MNMLAADDFTVELHCKYGYGLHCCGIQTRTTIRRPFFTMFYRCKWGPEGCLLRVLAPDAAISALTQAKADTQPLNIKD